MKKINYIIIFFISILALVVITNTVSAEWFGSKTGAYTDSTSFENRIVCGRFLMNGTSGSPNNITAYISIPVAGGGVNKTIAFAIYDNSGVLVARTYQKNITAAVGRYWITLNINWTKNSSCLIMNKYYNLTIWGVSSPGVGRIFWDNSVGNGVFNKVNTGQFKFPNPISGLSTNDSSATLDIYCYYNITTTYSINIISNVYPTENTTYNVSRITCHSNFSFTQNNTKGFALRTLVWVDMILVHSIYLSNYNATVKFQLDTQYNNFNFAFGEKHNLTINVSCMAYSNYTNVTYKFSYIRYPLSLGGNTSLTIYNNTQKTTGKYQSVYSSLTGWKVWLNYTGLVPTIIKKENIINSTGSHNSKYWDSNYTFKVWANYTGNLTPLHHFENIINASGTHFHKQNSTGYYIWANYTGNFSCGNISSFHIFLNLSGVIGFINWTGDISSNLTNLSFNISSNMSIQGNADVNVTDDFLYIAGFDIDEPFLLLSILFALFFFWWKAESLGMMYIMTMLLIPYIVVVGIVYLLPLYIVDVNILLFVRLIFLMLTVGIGGFTIDRRAKSKKVGHEKKV